MIGARPRLGVRPLLWAALWVALSGGAARASVLDFFTDAVMSHSAPKPPGDQMNEKPRTVMLNGFPMYVQTGKTDKHVKDVLDFYQSRYQGGALKALVGRPVGIRKEGEQTGMLLTVEVADKETAMEMMAGKRTLVTGGPVRLVYARRSGLYTDYLMAWSDKPMPQALLQPVQSGDAPGADLPGAPRPMGSVRSLNFAEPKAGYTMLMYVLQGSPESALRSSVSGLVSAGWQEDAAFGRAAVKQGKQVGRLSKGDKDLVVTARVGRGGETQVSYLLRDL